VHKLRVIALQPFQLQVGEGRDHIEVPGQRRHWRSHAGSDGLRQTLKRTDIGGPYDCKPLLGACRLWLRIHKRTIDRADALRCLLLLLRFYQRFISPLLGQRCRFYPSCSHYAAQAIARHGAMRGSYMTVCRLGTLPPRLRGRQRPGAAGVHLEALEAVSSEW
jgi:putative membrane protein insertion efficiency factor